MKNAFSGYYGPSQEEFELLWKEAVIVVDTNVLLGLYRLPSAAREELLSVLDLMKERIWIPHQVALEFQKNRIGVIASERKATGGALEFLTEQIDEVRAKVERLQLDKRGLGISTADLVAEIEKAHFGLVEAVRKTHERQLDISATDPIRERLDSILEGHVGPPPADQKTLDLLTSDGDFRFADSIPPGFKDSEKAKNSKESTFVFDHIRYQRKFGDLILWKQLLAYVESAKPACVLFVTSDQKEDWWWREEGKTIGPHPELVREIQRNGSPSLFWMYTAVQFLEHATKYAKAKVSTESVAEVKQAAQEEQLRISALFDDEADSPAQFGMRGSSYFNSNVSDIVYIRESLAKWLEAGDDPVQINTIGFPPIVRIDAQGAHGYDVRKIRDLEHLRANPAVINSLLRGYLARNERQLKSFSLALIVPAELVTIYSGSDSNFKDVLARLLARYPIDCLLIGTVVDGAFKPFATERREFDE